MCYLFVFWCSAVSALCEVDNEVGCSCGHCCCCSVTKPRLTRLCGPTDCNTPGSPFLQHLPEFAQTRVHWVGDCMKPSHPRPYSSFAFNFSQHQGLFDSKPALHIRWPTSIGTSTSSSVLPMNVQCWFPLELTGLIPLLSRGLSRVFSHIIAWKHQFFGAQPSLWSNSHIHAWY